MAKASTEDRLVGKPAIELFAELGWQAALPYPPRPYYHAGLAPWGYVEIPVPRGFQSVAAGMDARLILCRSTKRDIT
jgi:hypothetical protein